MQNFPRFNQLLSLPDMWARHPMPTHPWRWPGVQWMTLLSAMWWGTADQWEQWQHLLLGPVRWVQMGTVSHFLPTLLLTNGAPTPTTFGWLLPPEESPWGSTVTEQVEWHWTVSYLILNNVMYLDIIMAGVAGCFFGQGLHIYLVIDRLFGIKFAIRTSCDGILDHPSHHGHIVYSKCACMQVYTVDTMYVCIVYCFTRSPHVLHLHMCCLLP